MRTRRNRTFIATAIGIALVIVIAIGAFVVISSPRTDRRPAPTAANPTTPPPDASATGSSAAGDRCPSPALGAPANPELAADLAQIAADNEVAFQASWYQPDAGVITVGELDDLPAWSTAKVPLALAVIQSGQQDAFASSISAALRWSDNEAADLLWQAVGANDDDRAQAVTAVLREAGDRTTVVPATQLRPPFSVFGQTQWTTADQIDFLIQLPCLSGSQQVIEDMANVSEPHRWGIGALPNSVSKGGWGPEDGDGEEIVRQFGWYSGEQGETVPIAFAVQTSSFEAGVRVLDEFTAALAA